MDCQEYREIIAAHVDGALSSKEGMAVQSHLNGCPRCKQKYLWETEATRSLRQRLSLISARPGLREKLLDQLGETSKEEFFGWSYMSHGLVAAFALLLLLAVPYLFWRDKVQEEIFTDAIAQYQMVTQGIGDTPQGASPLTPGARVLDLSPWGYRLLAKQSQQLKGQEGRVFIYQGQEKEYLLAQEFDGVDYSLPPSAGTIRVSGRDFVNYTKGNVNLIGWKEKDVLCILASNLPKEKLLSLAQEIALGS
jgi:hypothetical protein